jgi:hypothetical protein
VLLTYLGPQLPGADIITGCADSNSSGTIDAGEPCGTATKAWLLPSTTPGHVTGGGQVMNAAGTDQVAFGFDAKSDKNGVKGECNLVDRSLTGSSTLTHSRSVASPSSTRSPAAATA